MNKLSSHTHLNLLPIFLIIFVHIVLDAAAGHCAVTVIIAAIRIDQGCHLLNICCQAGQPFNCADWYVIW